MLVRFSIRQLMAINKTAVAVTQQAYNAPAPDIFAHAPIFQAFLDAQRDRGLNLDVSDFSIEGLDALIGTSVSDAIAEAIEWISQFLAFEGFLQLVRMLLRGTINESD